jgi:alkylation response protein AidB-like acyl-CoA dehydrogenase
MNLLPDEQQTAIITTVRKQAEEWFPLEPAGPDATDVQWRRVVEAGWLTLGLPEALGGTGLGVPGDVLLFRELGRQLAAGPLLPMLVAQRLAVRSGRPDLAGQIASAITRVGLVMPSLPDWPQETVPVLHARRGDLALRLTTGRAQLLEIAEITGERATIDDALPVSMARLCATGLDVSDEDGLTQTHLWVLIAALASGICEATTARSTSYAKVRTQFGKPIGAFQAVSHRCASMATRAEVAWMQTLVAALSFGEYPERARAEAAAARLLAVDYAAANAGDNIQNYGGIGFTTEVAEHRFLKRARMLDALERDRETVADSLLPSWR